MNMNEGDTDTGLEENGEPAEELPEETGKEETEASSDVAEEGESPWAPPTEEEHRALLDIKEKTDSIFEELLRARAEFENFKKVKAREAARDRTAAVRDFIGGLLPAIDNFE